MGVGGSNIIGSWVSSGSGVMGLIGGELCRHEVADHVGYKLSRCEVVGRIGCELSRHKVVAASLDVN
jgi:hypothetical protein